MLKVINYHFNLSFFIIHLKDENFGTQKLIAYTIVNEMDPKNDVSFKSNKGLDFNDLK